MLALVAETGPAADCTVAVTATAPAVVLLTVAVRLPSKPVFSVGSDSTPLLLAVMVTVWPGTVLLLPSRTVTVNEIGVLAGPVSLDGITVT